MRVRRRSLRKALVGIGCLVGAVELPWLITGALLLAAGSALHLWSKGCLEQNQRLVTSGPYRFSRNPFYLANLLIDLGLGCVIGRIWVALPYLVLWWLAYRETIRLEEERLSGLFPAEFERYAAAVPRLIPTGRSLPREESTGGFTLANPALAQGSEYARIVGVWLAAAAIVTSEWIRERGLDVFAAENTAGLGLLALLPLAWVVKLALAELFRRPETALLPYSADPSRRRPITLLLVLAVYFAAGAPERAQGELAGSIAFVAVFGLILVLPFAKDSLRLRAGLQAGVLIAVAVFAASRGVLWAATPALIWIALAALDDLALERMRRGSVEAHGDTDCDADSAADSAVESAADRDADAVPAERQLWSKFAAIAIIAVAGTAVVAVARRFV